MDYSAGSKPTTGRTRGARRRLAWVPAAAAVGVAVVFVLLTLNPEVLFPQSRVECSLGTVEGNVSAWKPTTIAAAPYLGTVEGKLIQNALETYGRSAILLPIDDHDGNATAYFANPYNWTVVAASNITVAGAGSPSPCLGPLEALLTSNPSVPGGASKQPLATGQVSDTELPGSFNATYMCAVIDHLPSNCAGTTFWNVNYSGAQGVVTTCGNAQNQSLETYGPALPATVDFAVSGRNVTVPVAPGQEYLVSGSEGSFVPLSTQVWLNYTFPANTGTWSYARMPGYPPDQGGLVFAYSSCSG